MKIIRLMTILAAVLFFTTLANAQARTEEVVYSAKLRQLNLNTAKSELAGMLNVAVDRGYKEALVFDDRIELTRKKSKSTIVNFSELLDDPIVITKTKFVKLRDLHIYMNIEGDLKYLADLLFFFQHRLNVQRYDSLISLFKPTAAQYCALKVKPTVSEEQRKYIVQANSLNQDKIYDKAIELYNKAIEMDQTAYPAAYSNVALLSAQLYKFDAAIYYMKKYILLEPESADARIAQDKIYEWEIKMQK
jgi:tetratricopeptide (TPR) repeat protein